MCRKTRIVSRALICLSLGCLGLSLGAEPPEKNATSQQQSTAGKSDAAEKQDASGAAEASAPRTEETSWSPGAGGFLAYIDPQTGRLLSEPPEGAPALGLSQKELEMLSRSTLGLSEELLPGGGYMVRLRGRFQSFVVASVGEDGLVKSRCIEGFQPAERDHAGGVDGDQEGQARKGVHEQAHKNR